MDGRFFPVAQLAIEFGRARGKHEQVKGALLAGEFELSGELASAIDLHGPDVKGMRSCHGLRSWAGGWSGGGDVGLNQITDKLINPQPYLLRSEPQ